VALTSIPRSRSAWAISWAAIAEERTVGRTQLGSRREDSSDGAVADVYPFLAELVLPGVARSVPVARHSVERVLTAAGHQNVYGMLLVVSELVGNAVEHSYSRLPGGLITIDVREIDDDTARIDVIDDGAANVPRMRESSETSCRGRGLRIVEQTAVRWGVREDALGGNAVWAEVLTTEDAQDALFASALDEVEVGSPHEALRTECGRGVIPSTSPQNTQVSRRWDRPLP
jgi:anti-sigma regulatory factor (Ser/Thr protein kinase)